MKPFGAVWSEDAPLDRVEGALPALDGVVVNLAWPGDAGFALAAAHRVHPWLLLPRAEGYWAGAENAEAFCAAARALMRRWAERGLEPTTLIVDLEPPFARVTGIEVALRERRYRDALAWLRRAPDVRVVRAAERTYAGLVRDAHAAGWRVHLTTLPFVLDGGARQRRVRDHLGLPVDGPDWDRVSVQAYRTLFSDFAARALGRWGAGAFGPHVVRAYGGAVIDAFGDRGALDVGLVGSGVFPAQTYAGPDDLARDLAAARMAGVPPERTHVFDLGGMLARGVDAWAAGAAGPIRRDPGTPLFRGGVRLASRLLAR